MKAPQVRNALGQGFKHFSALGCYLRQELGGSLVDELSALILILTIKQVYLLKYFLCSWNLQKPADVVHAHSDLNHCPILHLPNYIFIIMLIFASIAEVVILQ